MERLSQYVTKIQLTENGRVFIMPTHTKDIVTIEGSVLGGKNMLPRLKSEVANITAELLTAGTKKMSTTEARGALAKRGATLRFSTNGDRTHFAGSCLPENLGELLDIIAEYITDADFPAKEVRAAKERSVANLEKDKNITSKQAEIAFSHSLFDKTHVNYIDATKEHIQKVLSIKRADLLNFGKLLGRGGLVLAIVGDVKMSDTEKIVAAVFEKMREGATQAPAKEKNSKGQKASEKLIPISGKTSIDFNIGHALPFTYDDSTYLPFAVLIYMLGGGGIASMGHLMSTLRERDGLTYGVHAALTGFDDHADGAFRVFATFSPNTYAQAVEMVRKEMEIFFDSCITSELLQLKQEQIIGSHLIKLSASRGLAGILHKIGIESKSLSYIDDYPNLIRAVTVQDLKDARKLINLDKLALTASGTFES